MKYWLLKTEPGEYSFADLVAAGEDTWDGVRNPLAQKHLQEMSPGDKAFIYHTGREKAIVGCAVITSAAVPDPGDSRYKAVRLKAEAPLPRAVTLKEIKADPAFSEWELVRLPRLSVMPVSESIRRKIMQLAGSPPA